MTVLIKGGTVVTADQTYRGDVLCADGKIVEIGANIATPARGEVVDAGGQFVMPGGIDPHTHMQLPFMGTVASDDFYHRHRGRPRRRHDDDHRFRDPESEAADHGGASSSGASGREKSVRRLFLPRRHHLVGRERARRTWATLVREHGVNSFKHFMAYKNAIMCDDETLVNSFSDGAEARRHRHRARGERRPGVQAAG